MLYMQNVFNCFPINKSQKKNEKKHIDDKFLVRTFIKEENYRRFLVDDKDQAKIKS